MSFDMLVLFSRFKKLIIQFTDKDQMKTPKVKLRDEQICLEKLKEEEISEDAF